MSLPASENLAQEPTLGLLPRGSKAAEFEPIDRIVEAIISPEDFASDDEAWGSKNSNSARLIRFRVEIMLNDVTL